MGVRHRFTIGIPARFNRRVGRFETSNVRVENCSDDLGTGENISRYPFFPEHTDQARSTRAACALSLHHSRRAACGIDARAALTQNPLFTVIETLTFSHQWPDYWNENEHDEFVSWLASNPEAGAVIPGSGGCRKVRWSRSGSGKRGGVRVIHYNRLRQGLIYLLLIYLLLIYAKNARDSVDATTLRRIRSTLDGEDD